MSKTATIPWAELSEKHVNYIRAAFHNKMNVAEGAIRSGKTECDNCGWNPRVEEKRKAVVMEQYKEVPHGLGSV